MHRLFVALRPPPPVRRQLLATMAGIRDARWQDDEQLHLTIRFVGEVDTPVAERVAEALLAMSARSPLAHLAGVGAFVKRGRTGAIWARLAPAEPLTELFRKVDRQLVTAGLAPEGRAFVPHVTVARFPARGVDEREVGDWLAAHQRLTSPSFPLEHLTLFRSELHADGARYEPVLRAALRR